MSSEKNPSKPAKILRACVVQGGKVLEEHRLKAKEELSIGTGPRNTFVLPDPSLPRSHVLFTWAGGKYELVFTEGMRGKISAQNGGQPVDFADLKTDSAVKKKGAMYHLELSEGHRGKVVVGESTIIFQFVVPPPAPAKPQLPEAARGSLWKSIDWPYAMALGLMIVLETPVVVAFQFAEAPEEVTLEDLKDSRWAELIVPEYKPEEKKEAPKQKGGEAAAQAKANKAEANDNDDAESAAQKAAARKSNIRKSVAGKGILAILGSAGDGSAGGAVADVFGSGGVMGGDLDGAFEGIAGVGLATSAGSRSTRGGGTGEAASIGGLATSGGGNVGLQGRAERKVAAVQAATPEVDGSLDSGAIARVVKSRMRSIQDCYEKELKRDPTLAGKIEIEFTIGSEGQVDEVDVASNGMGSDAVGQCIISRIKRWKFPKPDGGSVTVSYPFIFTSSS